VASIINRPEGHRWIQFVGADGKRRTVRLGKTPAKAADTVCRRIEELLTAKMTDTSMDRDLAGWLASIDATLQNKLAAVGLCQARESAMLGPFIKGYIQGRTDVKPATKEVWQQGETGLVEFFGANKPLRDVTPGDADRYKLHLIGKKLAPMTVRKRLQFATMVFRAAMRRRLIAESPFADVSIKASMPCRERFITLEETRRLLEACPNHHWRAIVALARYGGLRCPSEVLSLRWQDIDWDAGRIVVTSPKTEHHPGKATRTIPLFPELRPTLDEAFALAAEGAVYVVDERMRASSQGKAGWRNCNLRTTFEKIIHRAGLTPWPRLFHNLRSSRQTELAEQFPSHVVCSWLGNSEDIARKHYYQTTDEHFIRALGNAEQAKQNPKQLEAVSGRGESQPETVNTVSAEKSESMLFPAIIEADGEGFEPPVRFPVQRFSRPPP
jgi:integrase